MQTVNADSISDAFQKAHNLIANWNQSDPPYCWFRGSKSNTLSLQPGAYWRTGYTELQALVSFAQEGVVFTDIGTLDSWDTYYLAQHHRIPTRLLDWTESFSASLFAFDGWDGQTTPCIWIMQPELLNKASINWEGVVAPENNPAVDSWLPRRVVLPNHIVLQDQEGFCYDNNHPLAIYPKRTNTRINAQQGMFTIHGRNQAALPDIVAQLGASATDVFARIDLVSFDVGSVLSDLRLLGIRRAAVYPDIDNFVLDLKDYYEWA